VRWGGVTRKRRKKAIELAAVDNHLDNLGADDA
jgi:hypothetical protein